MQPVKTSPNSVTLLPPAIIMAEKFDFTLHHATENKMKLF
jgi:hypothetical protein